MSRKTLRIQRDQEQDQALALALAVVLLTASVLMTSKHTLGRAVRACASTQSSSSPSSSMENPPPSSARRCTGTTATRNLLGIRLRRTADDTQHDAGPLVHPQSSMERRAFTS